VKTYLVPGITSLTFRSAIGRAFSWYEFCSRKLTFGKLYEAISVSF